MTDLRGKVVLVAGATRGGGRGIAVSFGEAGAIVYCTGRSTRADSGRRARPDNPFELHQRPETIEETAEFVTERGGTGIAVRVDHSDPEQVTGLIARIGDEHGRLDILVNDIWGGEELSEWGKPLWELSLDRGIKLLERAVNTHIITSRLAVPLMLKHPGGLIIEVTNGAQLHYRGNLFYDLAKIAQIRLAFGLAEELRQHAIAAVALTPGFIRSEAMLDHLGVTASNWRDAERVDRHFGFSESPHYLGRAAVALALDPTILDRSGSVFSTWGLQQEYGFTDLDGSTPDWGAYRAEERFGQEQNQSHERFLRGFSSQT